MTETCPCLQIDVGNSSAKWRLMQATTVRSRGYYQAQDEGSLRRLLDCQPVPQQVWISSVAAPAAEAQLAQLLRDQWGVEPWFARTPAQAGGLRNSYSEPGRMGVDRWLAMLAAWTRVRRRVCVVDAGSALTIDVVSASGDHEGGYIIPGPALMERALLLDTDRVRFEEQVDYSLAPGKSTAEAVRHGVAVAQAGALRMVLSGQGLEHDAALVLCGGAAQVLQRLAGCAGDLQPDLVFDGLEIMAGLRE